jgi:hypothetical protein
MMLPNNTDDTLPSKISANGCRYIVPNHFNLVSCVAVLFSILHFFTSLVILDLHLSQHIQPRRWPKALQQAKERKGVDLLHFKCDKIERGGGGE